MEFFRMLTLDLNQQLETDLIATAKESGKTVTELLKELAVEYLEDCQDIKAVEQVLKDIENGTDELLSLEEAKKIYALDN